MSISWIALKSVEIAWNIIFFVFEQNWFFFVNIYKDGKSKPCKRKYWQEILKQYVKEPSFKGKE